MDLVHPVNATLALAASIVQSLGAPDQAVRETLEKFEGGLSELRSSPDSQILIKILPSLCDEAADIKRVVIRSASDKNEPLKKERSTKHTKWLLIIFRSTHKKSSKKAPVEQPASRPTVPQHLAQDVVDLTEYSLLITKEYTALRTLAQSEHISKNSLSTIDVIEYMGKPPQIAHTNFAISRNAGQLFDCHELVECTLSWLANSFWPLSRQ
jgi:hypothetical protein